MEPFLAIDCDREGDGG